MNETRGMTSIARKINMSFWLKRLSDVISFDLLLIILLAGVFFSSCEQRLPTHTRVTDRYFETDAQQEDVIYFIVCDEKNTVSYSVREFTEPFIFPAWILIGMQLIHLFFALFNTNLVRKKLRPLNDLAVRTQEISTAAFDTSKFDSLEHAIASVHADAPDVRIQTGDSDLRSIEIALNNLLMKMKESERQQVRFVSDASHELRTPISVIQGYVNMLDRWGKEDEEVLTESIEALKNESEHMKELIEQLLFLARGDSGRNSIHYSDFDLNLVMKEVWEESIMIDEKHIYRLCSRGQRVDTDEDGNVAITPCMVHGDLAMIKQSIRIFVQNAAKYSADGSTIKLDVDMPDGRPAYIISDEGVGMKSEDVVHIFERFYRSDEARNSETGGSGLGLSIAKWIVDAHDGKIDVLSRQDIGTRFTVTL